MAETVIYPPYIDGERPSVRKVLEIVSYWKNRRLLKNHHFWFCKLCSTSSGHYCVQTNSNIFLFLQTPDDLSWRDQIRFFNVRDFSNIPLPYSFIIDFMHWTRHTLQPTNLRVTFKHQALYNGAKIWQALQSTWCIIQARAIAPPGLRRFSLLPTLPTSCIIILKVLSVNKNTSMLASLVPKPISINSVPTSMLRASHIVCLTLIALAAKS